MPVKNSASDNMQIYPVFIPMQGCPHHCLYCDQHSFEAVSIQDFDVLQEQISDFFIAHNSEPKQVAFYGGTFTGLAIELQNQYYNLVAPFLDEHTSIRISTRPDYINRDTIEWCLSHQVKTIELGIQDFTDGVLIASERSYSANAAYQACLMVKETGFELGIQLMPGLPESSPATVEYNKKCLIEILPDILRLYPLIILAGTPLMDMYIAGRINPLSLEDAIEICADYIELAERFGIKVIKCGIPSLTKSTEFAGPYHPAFGELVKAEVFIRKLAAEYQNGQTLHMASRDVSLLYGHEQFSLGKLKKRLDLCTIKIIIDSDLPSGKFRLSCS